MWSQVSEPRSSTSMPRIIACSLCVRPWICGFALKEMIERGDAFVDYAVECGAAVDGATDTQGDAPKFWVVEDEHGRWHPDSGEIPFGTRRQRC